MLFLFINDLYMNNKIQTIITVSKKVLRKTLEGILKSIVKLVHRGSQVTPGKGMLSPSTPHPKGKKNIFIFSF